MITYFLLLTLNMILTAGITSFIYEKLLHHTKNLNPLLTFIIGTMTIIFIIHLSILLSEYLIITTLLK